MKKIVHVIQDNPLNELGPIPEPPSSSTLISLGELRGLGPLAFETKTVPIDVSDVLGSIGREVDLTDVYRLCVVGDSTVRSSLEQLGSGDEFPAELPGSVSFVFHDNGKGGWTSRCVRQPEMFMQP